MVIHIFTMVWIQNYDPNLDDLYLYTEPKLFPTYQIGNITGYNPNNFSKTETIIVDGVEKTISLDFSGIENTGIMRYGDGGGVYCGAGTCQTLPWPRCNASWTYTLIGTQGNAGGCETLTQESANRIFETTIEGTLRYPAKIINPIDVANAQFWENPNLWNHGAYTAHALVQNEDETGETVYIFTVAHPITAQPCARPQTFTFLDPETNQLHSREFVCPCVAWGLPVINPSAGQALACTSCCSDEYSILTGSKKSTSSDPGGDINLRLWVMKEGQNPLPSSIKRYKILTGPIRKQFPVYGIDSQFRVTKGIVDDSGRTVFQRNHHNIPLTVDSFFQPLRSTIKLSGGEGDDGGWSQFTVTPEGETIFVTKGSPLNGGVYIDSINNSINAPIETRCPSPETYFYKDSNGVLQFNTYCAPALFHPDLVIPTYPENDIKIFCGLDNVGRFSNSYINSINSILEQLDKPKIVSYTFPEFVINDDELNFPNISETSLNYPLKNSPYFSRQSKNTFFQNANLVAFDAQKMLQASELNELQEKFYKNQKNLIEFTNKWLSGINIFEKSTDILGFSIKVNENIQTEQSWTCSKIIPTDKISIKINSVPSGISVKIKPDSYMVNSIYEEADFNTNPVTTTSNKNQSIQFLQITEEVSTGINTNSLEEGQTILVIMNVDLSNLINCTQYQELKDNSGGSSDNSPCGARRNLLALTDITTYKLEDILNDDGELPITNREKYPFNTWAIPYSVPHLLMFIKKENGQINFYYANGIKIPN